MATQVQHSHAAQRLAKLCDDEMFTRQAIIINGDVKGIDDDDDGDIVTRAHTISCGASNFQKRLLRAYS